jgi:hypothetical protein
MCEPAHELLWLWYQICCQEVISAHTSNYHTNYNMGLVILKCCKCTCYILAHKQMPKCRQCFYDILVQSNFHLRHSGTSSYMSKSLNTYGHDRITFLFYKIQERLLNCNVEHHFSFPFLWKYQFWPKVHLRRSGNYPSICNCGMLRGMHLWSWYRKPHAKCCWFWCLLWGKQHVAHQLMVMVRLLQSLLQLFC